MNNVRYTGMGFLSWLTILFVFLKLTNYIDWSWWWVLSPIWIPWVILIAVVIISIIVCGGFYLFIERLDRRLR